MRYIPEAPRVNEHGITVHPTRVGVAITMSPYQILGMLGFDIRGRIVGAGVRNGYLYVSVEKWVYDTSEAHGLDLVVNEGAPLPERMVSVSSVRVIGTGDRINEAD